MGCGFRGSGPAPPAATRAAADDTVYSNEILGHRLGAFGRSAHRADSFTGTWPKMSVLAGSGAGPGGRESQNSTRRGRESRISATSPKTLEKLSFLDILNWSSFSFGPLPVQWRVRRTALANARAKLQMEVAGGERGGARKCRRKFWAAGMGWGRRQGCVPTGRCFSTFSLRKSRRNSLHQIFPASVCATAGVLFQRHSHGDGCGAVSN